MRTLFYELKRRNVFRIGIAYLISAWLLLQITDVLTPVLLLPDWVPRLVFLLLAIGFVPALIFAWAYELTPAGLRREKDVDRDESVSEQTGRRLNTLTIGILAVAVGLLLIDKYLLDQQPSHTAAERRPPTIAVLPFDAMSNNPDDENFADGLTEELLNSLAKIGRLGVVGRTSSFYYKDKPQDLREIGAALAVAHVLEGSVRRDGDRLRITAQLVETGTGFHVWSQSYDRDLNDIFAIQEEISDQVADAMQVAILGREAEALRHHGTDNPDAHARYLIASSYIRRGRAFGLDGSQELDNLAAARRLLEEATALDPGFAEAWAQLVVVYHQLTGWGVVDGSGTMLTRQEATQLAAAASSRAVEFAPHLPLAWSALGKHLFESRNYSNTVALETVDEAREAFERALTLDPENVTTLELYAEYLAATADYSTAVALYDRAIQLDPLSYVRLRRADALYLSGDAGQAWADYVTVAELYPDAPVNRGIARIEFDRGHLHHGIALLAGEPGAVQPVYAWRSLGDIDKALETVGYFAALGGEFEIGAVFVTDLLKRDYQNLESITSQLGHFGFPALWIARNYLRNWEQLIAQLDDQPNQIASVRNYFETFTNVNANFENSRRYFGVIASPMAYYAHVQDQLGNRDQAERLWTRSLQIAEMISVATPRGIQERHHVRLLVFASRGDIDAALDEFDAMAAAGWRWLMSSGSLDFNTVYAVDWGWFEDFAAS